MFKSEQKNYHADEYGDFVAENGLSLEANLYEEIMFSKHESQVELEENFKMLFQNNKAVFNSVKEEILYDCYELMSKQTKSALDKLFKKYKPIVDAIDKVKIK